MSTDAPLSLPDDPVLLKALLLHERAQSAAMTTHLEQTVQSQQKKIDQQQHEIARLLRRLYDPKQERIDPDQLLLFDGDDLTALAAELGQEEVDEVSTEKRRSQGQGRRELPAHLPREQRRYELSEEDRRCPGCGDVRCEIGHETSEQLEYIPASFKVIEHIRVKYACRRCQEHVETAAKAPQPIDKGLPGPGLLAQVVLSKYGCGPGASGAGVHCEAVPGRDGG